MAAMMAWTNSLPTEAGKLATKLKSSYWVKNDSTLWTWGRNYDYQLGHTPNSEKNVPTMVHGMTQVAQIIAGEACAFAVKADGTLYAWGFNGTSAQLGVGSVQLATPTLINIGDDERVKQLVNANYHTVVVTQTKRVYCWGKNDYGQLGVSSHLTSISKPRRQLDNEKAKMVAAGDNHTLAVTTDGKLYAWGRNNAGQLCDGTTDNREATTLITTGVKTVVAGADTTVIIKQDGGMWINANPDETEPLLTNVRTAVVANRIYVITNNNELLVMDGPTATKLMDDVKSVSAGGDLAFAIKNDLTLWTCDANPRQILTNVAKVSTCGEHTLALKKDGSIWVWGMNEQSQLGLGDSRKRYVDEPMKLAADSLPEPDEVEEDDLDEEDWAADVNQDGVIDVGDIMAIINVMAKIRK